MTFSAVHILFWRDFIVILITDWFFICSGEKKHFFRFYFIRVKLQNILRKEKAYIILQESTSTADHFDITFPSMKQSGCRYRMIFIFKMQLFFNSGIGSCYISNLRPKQAQFSDNLLVHVVNSSSFKHMLTKKTCKRYLVSSFFKDSRLCCVRHHFVFERHFQLSFTTCPWISGGSRYLH